MSDLKASVLGQVGFLDHKVMTKTDFLKLFCPSDQDFHSKCNGMTPEPLQVLPPGE